MTTAQELANALFNYQGPAQPYTVQTIALTSAHTDTLIYIPANCRFIQVFSDGGLEGVTIKIQDQSNYAVDLSKINTIATGGATRYFLTNDVRSGRSVLTMYYHFILPGERTKSGENISREELAARLGSISTFDRRGEVIFFDDFERGKNKWTETATGSSIFSLSNTCCFSGNLSGKLVTGASNNDQMQLNRVLNYINLNKMGFEIKFTTRGLTGTYIFSIQFVKYNGTNSLSSTLTYTHSTGVLSITDSSGAVSLGTISLNEGFNIFKLVADFRNDKYTRAILNENEYDISSYGLVSAVAASAKYFNCLITLKAAEAATKTGYIDDAIVTKNEP